MGYSSMGRFAEAVERGERALAVAEEYDDASLVCFAAWVLGVAHAAAATSARTRARPPGRRRGPDPLGPVLGGRPTRGSSCRAGPLEEGIGILEEAVVANRAARFIWSEVMATDLAEAYLSRAGSTTRGRPWTRCPALRGERDGVLRGGGRSAPRRGRARRRPRAGGRRGGATRLRARDRGLRESAPRTSSRTPSQGSAAWSPSAATRPLGGLLAEARAIHERLGTSGAPVP